ncbi:MAG: hypothetical protein LLG42_16275 [Chloroflexi bacterium]|nr:hypothetical protein [Chloroflexota bacterium]
MDEVWQKFLQQVLLNLVPIVVPLVIAWVGKICVDIWQKIKREQPSVAWYLTEAAEFAVNAAEQVGLSGALENYADSKLDYAMSVAQK